MIASRMNGVWKTPLLALALVSALALAGCQTRQETVTQRAVQVEADQLAMDTPPKARTQYALGRVLAAQGRDAEAIYVLRRVVQRFPEFLPAYVTLAESHLRLDQVNEAATVLGEALRRAPQDPVLLNDMGMTFLIARNYEEALPYFERAASLGGNPAYRANQATALAMLGRDAEAQAIYEDLLPTADAEHNLAVLRAARARVAPAEATDAAQPAEPAEAPAATTVQ